MILKKTFFASNYQWGIISNNGFFFLLKIIVKSTSSPETQIVAYPLYGSGEAASKNIKMMNKNLIKAVVVWLNECLK